MRLALTITVSLLGVSMCQLGGCAPAQIPEDGTTFRAEGCDAALEEGFAITPLVAAPRIVDAREATALFTNEFFAALEAVLPGSDLDSPRQTLYRLDAQGSGAHARVRSLRRRLAQHESLDHEELRAIERVVRRRYVLVGWIEEATSEVSSGGGYYSHGAGDAPRGTSERAIVTPLTYTQVTGTVVAVIVDLREDVILWSATIDYETDRGDGQTGDLEEGLERTRAAAAIRLAEQVTSTAGSSPGR